MQKENIKNEIIISVSFIVLLVLLLNPFGFWMPSSIVYLLLTALVVVFAVFASFLWRESASDEREELHRRIAGRVGYLAGTSALVLGIVVQGVTSHVDPWLAVVLGVMVVGKIAGHLYSRFWC